MKVLVFLFFFAIVSPTIFSYEASASNDTNDTTLKSNRIQQKIFFNEDPVIKTIAGMGLATYSGDGGLAIHAQLNFPQALVRDKNANLYFVDNLNHVVRQIVQKTGIISTIAGTGTAGFSGDGGPAQKAQLNGPTGLTLYQDGLYIADSFNNRIRKVDLKSGTINTIAGSSSIPGYGGDGGKANGSKLNWPRGIAFDFNGNLFIADNNNHRIRKVDLEGKISTVAGNGRAGLSGAGGKAIYSQLFFPSGVAFDAEGNMYIADSGNMRICKVGVDGKISTLFSSVDRTDFVGIAVIDSSYLYVVDEFNNRIVKISIHEQAMSIVAGIDGNHSGFDGDHGSPSKALLKSPSAIFLSKETGELYISDCGNNRIRVISSDELVPRRHGDSPLSLRASSSSGLPVSYSSSNQRVAKVDNNIIQFVGAGSAIITAHQEGNSVFLPAKSVSRTLTILPRQSKLARYYGLLNAHIQGAYIFLGFVFATAIIGWVLLTRKKTKNKTLQSEKERIAQDLHDNIGSQLTSINLSVSRLAKEYPMADDKIETINKNINATILELRNSIWAINKEEVTIEELYDKIRNLFWRLSQSQKIDFVLQGRVNGISLNSISTVNLFRIIQEALINCTRHSGSEKVEVTLFQQGNELEVIVKDNGAGFDLEAGFKNDHYGLSGMQKRAKELKGILSINSQKDQGTTINFKTELKNLISENSS